MPKKIDLVRELYERTLKGLTETPESWCAFLESAAYQYKYPFTDQVLIYAQRPHATACAEIDIWNKHFNRWVNRGSSGIALITDSNYTRLRYVFDVGDTHNRSGELFKLWTTKPEQDDELISALENRFGTLGYKETMADAIVSATLNLSEDNLHDYLEDLGNEVSGSMLDDLDDDNLRVRLLGVLQQSVAYMVLTRLGYNASDYIEIEDFQEVIEFDTLATINCLGMAVSDVSEICLREIEKNVKALDREAEKNKNAETEKKNIRTFDEPQKNGYNKGEIKTTEKGGLQNGDHNTDLPRGEGRDDVSRSDSSGTDTLPDREIRRPAEAVSEGTPQGDIRDASDAVPSERASARDGSESEGNAFIPYEPTGDEPWGNRADEGNRPNEMGGRDEQHQGDSRGDGSERPDLRITDGKDLPDCMPEVLIAALRHGDYLAKNKEDIVSFLRSKRSDDEKNAYVKALYTEDLIAEFVRPGTKEYMGYLAKTDTLSIFDGRYKTRTAETGFTWDLTRSLIEALIKDDNYLDVPEKSEQMSLFGEDEKKPEVKQPAQFAVSQEVIDDFLRLGGCTRESTARIYGFYRRADERPWTISFLKSEYGSDSVGLIIGDRKATATWDKDGMMLSEGDSAVSDNSVFLKWETVEKRIGDLIRSGQYIPRVEAEKADGIWLDYVANQIADVYRDSFTNIPDVNKTQSRFNWPEITEFYKGILTDRRKLEPFLDEFGNNITLLDKYPSDYHYRIDPMTVLAYAESYMHDPVEFPEADENIMPQKQFVSQDKVDEFLINYGSGVSEGKYRILSFFCQNKDSQARAHFLSGEFGNGGIGSSRVNESHDGKGLALCGGVMNRDQMLLLPWSKVAKRIGELIESKDYMTAKELAGIDDYERNNIIYCVAHFYESMPDTVVKPFPSNLGFFDYDKIYDSLAPQISDQGRLLEIVSMMQSTFDSLMPESRGYDGKKKALENVKAYADGTFDLFPGMRPERVAKPIERAAEEPTVVETEAAEQIDDEKISDEYDIKLGETVYIGKTECIISSFKDGIVELFDGTLIPMELTQEQFIRRVSENPLNAHLKITQEEPSTEVQKPEVKHEPKRTRKSKEAEDPVVQLEAAYNSWDSYNNGGGSDPFWSDGTNMNLIRNHIIRYRKKIVEANSNGVLPEICQRELPPEMPQDYMAQPEMLREKAAETLKQFYDNETYQWCKAKAVDLTQKELKNTTIPAILNYVTNLENAIKSDDLLTMRRYKTPDGYIESFDSCRKQIEKILTVRESEQRTQSIFEELTGERNQKDKRFYVVESEEEDSDPYEVWDGDTDSVFIGEDSNPATFISRWQAEDFASEQNRWLAEKDKDHSGELFYEDKSQDDRIPTAEMQYLTLKEKQPDYSAAVRVGDFFEFYDEDAEKVAAILSLTLTSKIFGTKDSRTMCGFPASKLDEYYQKLTEQNVKIAIIDEAKSNIPFVMVPAEKTEPEQSDTEIAEQLPDDGKEILRLYENRFSDDRFYLDSDNRELVWEYFNPDSTDGGQILEYHIPYDRIRQVDRSESYADFFGQLEEGAKCYVTDVTSPDFRSTAQQFLTGAFSWSGYDREAMNFILEEVDRTKSERDMPVMLVEEPKKKQVNFGFHSELSLSEKHNFHITDSELGVGGAKDKFKRNIEAIMTLKQAENEDRLATPDEQKILSEYTGWGGLADVFDESKDNWANEREILKGALTEEEYTAARESTLTAFYTPPTVINAIYKALSKMGFKRGNILEPSCGIGNFIGMLPDEMKDSRVYGVELDSISGRIAQQLYQRENIAVTGFENTSYPDSFFDVAVGNVPFGQFKVADKKYDRNNFMIHDYFFAKTLDQVRPGGIIAFITSKGTLDKENPAIRKYIAQRADLIGAIRLPDTTFKAAAGTEAVADIIFLQKRDRIIETEPEWVHLGTDGNNVTMNSYFLEHPDMIMGEMVMRSGPFGWEPTCKPYDGQNLGEMLDDAINNIHAEIDESEMDELSDGEDEGVIPADPNVRNFSYTVVGGKVYYRENSLMKPVETSLTGENRIKGMVAIRDTLRELIDAQLDDCSDIQLQSYQTKLNRQYDEFIRKYGLINSRGNASVFDDDNAYFLLCSLEKVDDDGNLKAKADIFSKRTIKPKKAFDKADTSSEALAISLSERACVDLDYMSKLTGFDKEKIISDLNGVIFRDVKCATDPDAIPKAFVRLDWYNYVTADEYLSGNVREKLRMVEALEQVLSPEDFSTLETNLEALRAVQPQDLTAPEIGVRLGSTWLPPEDVQDFMYQLLGTPYYYKYKIQVKFEPITGQWSISDKSYDNGNVKATSVYGTSRINAYNIIEETLNLKDVRIIDYYEDADGKKKAVLNKKETTIAQGKQDEIKRAFEEWIWKDPKRRERLCRLYNEKFNSVRPREYNGDHIQFYGMSPEITLRKHQSDAVARIIYGGNTLLAHVVGAGKTFTMTAAAQEEKRIGLCSKSMFVVPNHLISQWASEYLQLYPSANILVATKKDFETKNRKKFCARIATGDYDAIIIGHSQFEKIPVSIERQIETVQSEINEILVSIDRLKYERGERFTVKQLERTRKQLQQQLEKLNDRSRKDDVVTFEQLGVDRLFIDEAHFYKNLAAYTKMRNVAGISQTEAQKSSDLYMKCRYLDELTGGKGVVFATGTPISNTMVELYTMQKYLQYGDMKMQGLTNFDAWASTFGETVTAIELAPEGYNFFGR